MYILKGNEHMIDVIINPIAGNGLAKRIGAKIMEALKNREIDCEAHFTTAPGHATVLAQECARRGSQTVLAVGGDGTAYEVASGLCHTRTSLGLIPAGTGNDFVKTIGVPKDPMQALEHILTHAPRPVDMGKMNDQLFLNVCGTGFDVSVLEYTLKAKKLVRGMLPYLYGVIRTIFSFKPVQMRIVIDQKTTLEGTYLQCSVANGRYFGGGIAISPTSQVDDGLLDVVVLRSIPNWKMFFYLPGLVMGKADTFSITSHYRCTQVQIDAKDMRLNVDGEILPVDTVSFSPVKDALLVHW